LVLYKPIELEDPRWTRALAVLALVVFLPLEDDLEEDDL
jgi:hypothetical protein